MPKKELQKNRSPQQINTNIEEQKNVQTSANANKYNSTFQDIADMFDEEEEEQTEEQKKENLVKSRNSVRALMPSSFGGDEKKETRKRSNSIGGKKIERDPLDGFVVMSKEDFDNSISEEKTEEEEEIENDIQVTTRSKQGNLRITTQEQPTDEEQEKVVTKASKVGFFQRIGLGGKTIKFDKKYTVIKEDDSKEMARIREKMYDALEEIEKENKNLNGNLSEEDKKQINRSLIKLQSLQRTARSYVDFRKCNNFLKLISSPIRNIKFIRRLKEVNDLCKRLDEEIEKRRNIVVDPNTKFRRIVKTDRYGNVVVGNLSTIQTLASSGSAIVRSTYENQLRAVGNVILYPAWLINEGIRKIVRWKGHKPQRHLKLPGQHTFVEYAQSMARTLNGKKASYEIKNKRDSHWYDKFFTYYKTDEDINERARLDMDMIDYDYSEEDNPDVWDEFKQYARENTEKEKQAVEDYINGNVTYVKDGRKERRKHAKDLKEDAESNKKVAEVRKNNKEKNEAYEREQQEREKAEQERERVAKEREKLAQERRQLDLERQKIQQEKEKAEQEEKQKDPIAKMLEAGQKEFNQKYEKELDALSKKYDELQSNLKSLEASNETKADKSAMRSLLVGDMRQFAKSKGIFDYMDDGVKYEDLKVEDYTDQKKEEYETYLRSRGLKIGKNAAANAFYRNRFTEFNQLAQDFVWKPGVDEKTREAYNWLGKYYAVRNTESEKLIKEKSKNKLNIPNHKLDLKDIDAINREYELQPPKSLNCFACAGAEMLRQFARQEKQLSMPVSQDSVRSFKPVYKNYEDVKDKIKEIDPDSDEEYFNKSKREVSLCLAGRKVGNIYELGDFFIDKHKNSMLNKVTLSFPTASGNLSKAEKEKRDLNHHNMKALLLEKIYEGLSGGHVVTVVMQTPMKHYRTIVGIDGEKIKFVDSIRGMHGTVHTQHVEEEFLPNTGVGQGLELVWMSKLEKPEELQKKYSHLSYSKENGFSNNAPSIDDFTQVAQTKGVNVSKGPEDTDYYINGVSESIYIPKFPAEEQKHNA